MYRTQTASQPTLFLSYVRHDKQHYAVKTLFNSLPTL